MKPRRTEGAPHDRLTRLGGAMADAMEKLPGYHPGDKAIIMLGDDKRSGLTLHGYADDIEAMADFICHLRALFEANGKEFHIGFGADVMDAAVSALHGGPP